MSLLVSLRDFVMVARNDSDILFLFSVAFGARSPLRISGTQRDGKNDADARNQRPRNQSAERRPSAPRGTRGEKIFVVFICLS